jgi:hypothetical protein
LHVVPNTSQVRPLEIGIEIDLDDAIADCISILFLGRTGASMEDEEDGLLLFAADLSLDVGLVLAKEFGM